MQTRQVLVDGVGAPALALAALLRQSGHNPVLIDAAYGSQSSAVTVLWPPGLHVLDVVGVGDTVRSAGRPLDAVTVRTDDGDTQRSRTLTAGGAESTPFLVDTETLVDALAEQVSGLPKLSMGVAAVTEHSNALEIEFANGVREFFDLAVVVDGSASTTRALAADRPDWTSLSGIEVPLDGVNAVPALSLDSWREQVAAQLLPPPNADENGVLRLLASPKVVEDIDVARTIVAAFPFVADDATAAWTAALDAAEWTQVSQAGVDTAKWAAGRVAYCGTAAFPTPRVAGIQPALALEDAWVLADELVGDPDDVAVSLAAYARRRRARLQTVFRRLSAAEEVNAYPSVRTEPLATTSRLRATALGSLSAGPLVELQRDVPARL